MDADRPRSRSLVRPFTRECARLGACAHRLHLHADPAADTSLGLGLDLRHASRLVVPRRLAILLRLTIRCPKPRPALPDCAASRSTAARRGGLKQ